MKTTKTNEKKMIVATGNMGKLEEIRQILSDVIPNIVSMKEAGLYTDVEETGSTFVENALLKCRAVAEKTDGYVLSDDSGLVVDALDGEPGIYSSRYLGEDTSYDVKNADILRRMEGVPEEKRTARFVCAVAVITPDKREIAVEGYMEGIIGHEIKGEHGFGYDPIFFLPEYGKTSAEILPEEKNEISHRGKALRLMLEELKGEQ
ncbi:MAG: XTP/dITP diphosphatase [Eubacterium sp.]|nr:XTP/dITP diphosphatase [Eubacterium sp.]